MNSRDKDEGDSETLTFQRLLSSPPSVIDVASFTLSVPGIPQLRESSVDSESTGPVGV